MKKSRILLVLAASSLALVACQKTESSIPTSSSTPASSLASSSKPSSSTAPSSSAAPSSSVAPSSSISSSSVSSTVSSSSSSSSAPSSSVPVVITVTLTGDDTVVAESAITLTATVTGATDTSVTWTTSDATIATVASGVVTGVAAGSVTIRATSVADVTKFAEKTITVTAKPVVSYTLAWEENPATKFLVGGNAVVLKGKVTGVTTETVTYAYSKDNSIGALGAYTGNSAYEYFTPANQAGSTTVSLKATIGTWTQTITATLSVAIDTTKATEIAKPDDLYKLLTLGGTIMGSYYLSHSVNMDGYSFDGKAVNANFVGNIDGQGYTIDNLTVDAVDHMNAAMFRNFNGSFINTRVNAIIKAKAWSGIVGGNVGGTAYIQNNVLCADFEGDASTVDWQFNGAVGGVVTGATIIDNVIDVFGTYVAQHFAIAAYINGTPNIVGNYTNAVQKDAPHGTTDDRNADRVSPLQPSEAGPQTWVGTFDFKDNVTGNIDFATAPASTYTALDSTIWTLADNAMPVLAHNGDTPVQAAPSLTASSSLSEINIGTDVGKITLTAAHFAGDVTYSFTGSENYATYATVTAEADHANIFDVTPVAAGSITLTFTATRGEQTATATAVALTIVDPGAAPVYTIPDNATEIKNAADFKAYFNGSAEHTAKNAYLSADIDLGGWFVNNIEMAGEWNAIFEGQGHTITNFTASRPFFNILGKNAEVRNMHFTCDDFTGSGFGVVTYQNNGRMKNIDVDVTFNTTAQNTVGAVSLNGNGTYTGCDTTLTFNFAGSNTIYPIAQEAGATFENCTYFVGGTANHDGAVVTPTSAGISLRVPK